MIGSSKILTVSYGTFSCTLEGFDDSFSTMKAIAEYFRGLAADDRYFGAEPPTPDAEMLARIAERETSRRVEARPDDNGNGIVLRAAAALAGPTADEAAADAEAAEEQAAAEAVAAQEQAAAENARVAAEKAAKAEAELAAAEAAEQEEALKAAAAEQALADAQEAAPAMPPVAKAPAIQHETEVDEPDTAMSFADMSPAPLQDELPAHPDAESVAAKLQRIRAVVGTGAAAAQTDVYAEDQHAGSAEPQVHEVEPLHVEDEADLADEIDMSNADLSDLDEQIAEVPAPTIEATPAETVADAEAETTVEAMPSDASSPQRSTVRARIVRLRKDPAPQVDATGADDGATPDVADNDLIANVLGADAAPEDIAEDAQADVEAYDIPTDEDDFAEVETQEYSDEDETSADDLGVAALDGASELMGSAQQDEIESDLSDEDEAALLEELAEVEAEQADVEMGAGEVVETESVASEEPQRQGRDILPATDDAAMSRIMTQTDEALSEPEGSRRRNAIAQLKAAVAATEAARQLGDQNTEKAETETAFREDLDEVVRPAAATTPAKPARPTRPVVSDEARTARPRPTPLKLVASQRVDAGDAAEPAAPAAQVQPRRVSMAAEVATTDAASFAEFAEEMGATELPDLLEAAAAYTAFVEGVEDFSRPQIMKKVQLTSDQAFSREDGLRSFGTLLRQGRISKVRNGRFQVSEQTRFRPEERAS